MRFHLPALSGKESRRSHCTSRGDDPYLKVERNSRGHTTIPKDPDVPIPPDIPDSPTLIRLLSTRVLTLNMMAPMTPFDILRQNHRFLWQLDRKPDTTVTAGEESGLACLHRRPGLTPLWKLHNNCAIHVKTGEEFLWPELQMRT